MSRNPLRPSIYLPFSRTSSRRPASVHTFTNYSSLSHSRLCRPPEQHPSGFRPLSTSHALLTSSKPPSGNVLEKPDKFRPPSHPQRMVPRRSTPKQYPGPPLSEEELQTQRTKRYPHMFPSQGTTLHWFLTTRWIHAWITMSVLSFLAIISLTQTFIQTSPYGELIPPFAHFFTHPIASCRETLHVISMHINYTTEQTALKRQQNILDAQKRRLYRRAHGMEDLDADEQGVDVRGLVPWDDGLTNRERREGGRKDYRTPQQVMMGESMGSYMGFDDDEKPVSEQLSESFTEGEQKEQFQDQQQQQQEERPQRRKVKKWLGIW